MLCEKYGCVQSTIIPHRVIYIINCLTDKGVLSLNLPADRHEPKRIEIVAPSRSKDANQLTANAADKKENKTGQIPVLKPFIAGAPRIPGHKILADMPVSCTKHFQYHPLQIHN